MKKELVSVIVPAYNAQSTIRKCLGTLAKQTYPNYEVIVINDGSTDATAEICMEYERKYPFMHVYHRENGGEAKARNMGMKLAQGEWICFVDADDYVDADYIQTLHSLLRKDDKLSICGFTEEGRGRDKIFSRRLKPVLKREEAVYELLKENSFRGYVWNKMFRRTVIEENQLHFDEKLEIWLDVVFVFQYMMCTEQVSYTPKSVYHYRYYPNSISHLDKKECSIKRSFDVIKAQQYIENWLPQNYQKVRRQLHVRMVKSAMAVIRNIGYASADLDSPYFKDSRQRIKTRYKEVWFHISLKEHMVAILLFMRPGLLMKLYQRKKTKLL